MPARNDRVPATNASRVAVIVVNWRRATLTLECLAALRQSRGVAWHLYIVDNASGDDSVERLSDLGPDVTLLVSATNSGWSGGNNLGVRAALAAGHDRIFLLNNDALVEPETLSVLSACLDGMGAELPVLGPVHVDPQRQNFTFAGATTDPATGMPTHVEGPISGLPDRDLIESAYVKGAGLFAHRRHFDEIGFFDDDFYLNYDEADWCYRARAAGFRNLIVPASVIVHEGAATIGAQSALMTYFLVRNQLLFGEKHCTLAQRARFLRHLQWKARHLEGGRPWLSTWLLQRKGPTAAFRQGLWDYLRRRFGDCPPAIRDM